MLLFIVNEKEVIFVRNESSTRVTDKARALNVTLTTEVQCNGTMLKEQITIF